MIFGLLLNISWNANLKSYLTTKKINMPFDSLEKLLDATNYKIALIPESAQEEDFKLSSDPIKQKVYIQRIKPYLYDYGSYSGRGFNYHIHYSCSTINQNIKQCYLYEP